MRLPWVPRALLDRAEAELARVRADLEAEEARTDRLIEQLATMQRAGFKVADSVSTPPEPTLPPAVTAAITDHMELSGSVGRQTAQWAESKVREGWPVEQIVRAIHDGEQEAA